MTTEIDERFTKEFERIFKTYPVLPHDNKFLEFWQASAKAERERILALVDENQETNYKLWMMSKGYRTGCDATPIDVWKSAIADISQRIARALGDSKKEGME